MILAEDVEVSLNITKQSDYSKFFGKDISSEETIISASRAFRKATLEYAVKTRIGDIFNIGTPFGLLIEKGVEVDDLIDISIGIEHSMKIDDVWNILLMPTAH